MRPRALGVIGLGPVGRALGGHARAAGIGAVLAWSPEPAARVAAVRDGVAHDAPARAEDVAAAVDLLVLTLPADRALELLPRLAPRLRPGSLLTDTAAVKRPLAECAAALGLADCVAGSHPLLPLEALWPAAAPFRDALVYVTPTPGSGGDAAAREVAHFWESALGAAPVLIDAAQHDAQTALTHQLPALAAVALAATLAARLPAGARVPAVLPRVAPPSPVEAWANRATLVPALRALARETNALADACDAGAPAALGARLAAAEERGEQPA